MKNKYITWGINVFMIGSLVMACTEVDFKDPTATTPTATFSLSWPNDEYSVQSDSLLIVTSRIIDTWRSAMRVDASNGNGTLLFPVESNSSETETTSISNWANWPLKTGDFDFIATTAKESAFTFSDVTELESDYKKKLANIKTSYKLFPINSTRILQEGETWDDINQYAESSIYFDSTAGPLCTLRNDFVHIKSGKSNDISLEGQYITQRINITFQTNIETGITVQSTLAELSGIPVTVYPASAGFAKDNTCKVIVRPSVTNEVALPTPIAIGGDPEATTINANLITFSTSVDVISWMHNKSSIAENGDGILSIALTCQFTDNTGATQTKTYQGKINLYNTLTKLNPTEYAGKADGLTLYKNKNSLVDLSIADKMTITKEGITTTTTSTTPDKWIVNK